ncbi:MAG: chromosome segregation protein SMC [Ruminococcus sp.]|nr:chromosome segregation protein SMC [Ruminococcus sp.]
MYLKSLDIQGFKSFPDKINLTFDKGLTAVVGPNGSGKSNIGDAVRWVLGEQSTKTLRGNKMEDVIFSGTVTRKPMGFAIVTLNIDNSDGKLDGMGDEVAITRKLYRNGDSEYMINAKPVRLKDINELFMDTGMGRDGYSIIGQGRIAEIVGAKSNDRRDIFEEAAGISKFRHKKNEAEKKLSHAQENIVRLADILSELKSRIEPLRIQSEKAEKFIRLSGEKKILEISVWVCNLDELTQKIDKTEEKILSGKTEYQNIQNDIQEQEQLLNDCFRQIQICTAKSDEIRQKMIDEEKTSSEIKSKIAVLENDIEHSETAISEALKNIEERQDIKKSLITDRNYMTDSIETLGNEKINLEKEIAVNEEILRKTEREISAFNEHSGNAGDVLKSMYIKQSEKKFSAENTGRIISEETEHITALNENSLNIAEKITEYSERKEKLFSELGKIRNKISELEIKISEYERLYITGKNRFQNISGQLKETEYNLREIQQKHRILTEMESNMEGFTGSVKSVLRQNISGVYGTVAGNIGVPQKYAVAIETALGIAMQNIIVDNEETAKKCMEFLKKNKSGRATFLPVTSIYGRSLNERGLEKCGGFVAVADNLIECKPEFQNIVSSLTGRTVIAEDITTATEIAKIYKYRFRIVTLDGQIINSGGSFTGGSVQKTSGIITRRNEINLLEKNIEKLSGEYAELLEMTEKINPENQKISGIIESLKSEITDYKNKEIRINTEISGLESLLNQLEMQNTENISLIKESEKKLSDAQEENKKSTQELAEISEKILIAEKNLEEEKSVTEKLNRIINEISVKISEMKIKHTAIVKDIQAKTRDVSMTGENIKSIDKEIAGMNENIKILEKSVSVKNHDIEKIRQQLENFQDNTAEYIRLIEEYQEQHTHHNRLVNEIQQNLKIINSQKEKSSAEITRLSERRENLKRDYDKILKQLLDVYELTYSEAVGTAVKIDNLSSAQKKLSGINTEIKSLGGVNTDAIEEYREVKERYEFMSGQIKDIQKSKAELEKIISGLTVEMKRIFLESFNIINKNFQEIFSELFGGGKAELVLTDSEDVLTSGIEIKVAPPGKVIKNLISLSGGEQSFVAVAIYFAILKLRPAPFCILDEIDAALDEVNVRKYAQYLRKFTDTTQFVLVTHRRSAMEEADVLYGVTMQEDGISKLLKMEQVDFQEDTADIQ